MSFMKHFNYNFRKWENLKFFIKFSLKNCDANKQRKVVSEKYAFYKDLHIWRKLWV